MPLASLLVALQSAARQDAPLPTPFADALAAVLDERVPDLLARSGEPGLAVALVEGGAVARVRGFGLADREAGRSVDGDTLFNVGSISKPVTAWEVLHLVDAGVLELDAPVGPRLERWSLPESEFDPSGVTVGRLLRHTAGLSQPEIRGHDPGEPLPTLEQELARDVRLVLAPGTRFEYSGGGYTLLQLLVEEVTGKGFADAMRADVLEPLGMTASRYAFDPEHAERYATPYTTQLEDDGDATGQTRWHHRVFVGLAGAGLYTSANDLGRFLAAHCEGPDGEPPGRGVLRPETVGLLATTSEAAPHQGLGYEVPPPAGSHTILMHGGSNAGWRAQIMLAPDLGIGIAVLTNTDGKETLRAVLGAFRDAVLERVRAEAGH